MCEDATDFFHKYDNIASYFLGEPGRVIRRRDKYAIEEISYPNGVVLVTLIGRDMRDSIWEE